MVIVEALHALEIRLRRFLLTQPVWHWPVGLHPRLTAPEDARL